MLEKLAYIGLMFAFLGVAVSMIKNLEEIKTMQTYQALALEQNINLTKMRKRRYMMSSNPNTVKSQDELNEGGRKSDVLLSTIEELERTKKQLDIAVKAIKAVLHDEFILEHADAGLVMYLTQAEYKIKELNK